jgi:hypothetical protein
MSSTAGQIGKANVRVCGAGNGVSCLQPTSSHLQTAIALRIAVDNISLSPVKPILVSGFCCQNKLVLGAPGLKTRIQRIYLPHTETFSACMGRVTLYGTTRHDATGQYILSWFSHALIHTSPSPAANDKEIVAGMDRLYGEHKCRLSILTLALHK